MEEEKCKDDISTLWLLGEEYALFVMCSTLAPNCEKHYEKITLKLVQLYI